jgi:hypothetical protein
MNENYEYESQFQNLELTLIFLIFSLEIVIVTQLHLKPKFRTKNEF